MNRLLNLLLSHLVALGFLLFALAALIWRGPLFGLDSARAGGTGAEAPPAAENPRTPERPAPEPQLPEAATPKAGPEHKAEDARRQQAASQPGDESAAAPPARDKTVFRPLEANEMAPATPAGSAGRAPHFRAPEQAPALPDRLVQAGPDRVLRAAREAFWNKHYAQAERLYLRYLGMRPEDGAIFAELGNLYQSMQRRGDAMDAYYEAALRFRAQGAGDLFRQVREILRKGGDPRARDLGAR